MRAESPRFMQDCQNPPNTHPTCLFTYAAVRGQICLPQRGNYCAPEQLKACRTDIRALEHTERVEGARERGVAYLTSP